MPITITMPALSPTMEEGTLASWQVKAGDTVAAGDVLCEIETDKATMEVEAVDEGTIGKLLVEAGTEGVKVNAPIAVLLEEGEDESALEGYEPEGGAAPPPAETAQPEPEAPRPAKQPAASAADDARAPAPKPASGGGGRIFASPLAKRMAEQAGLDLAAIEGSGPKGRVVKRDIEAAVKAGTAKKAAPQAAATAAAAPAPTPLAVAGDYPPATDDYEEIKLNSMRKTIARRLTEAKQTIPHFYLTMDIELDRLLAMRKDLNGRSDAYRISVNDFIIRATALALHRHPEINAQFTGEAILQHRKVDVSVAVAIEGGLITPVIRDADRKGLVEIANQAKDLAGRARDGKLKPEEYQGGTCTVSNLGMFGIDQFVAVINPPQSTILAVGSGKQKPVVKDGALAVATVMTATLSCDHRVYGGAEGARFLETLKGFLEDPVTMLL
ncbi:pyruvate dehydrogenase complex dihydrolipoamide acetyltransferase [Minwuia thermotolerans]|uniref:Acetyltransferase component of pyruvate dehydrogenase complex n=1 Tax=Minwuia thermotolerans TaxID=2056226 RepID=A0A2M9G6U2_9PROT|nr:pyruvate dehydrogenase complex dihydrolipoamide acetyltransferase [Minwuia thermotolerans]PJK31423.1 pyruvate dehydrogenase complex dihydrolipoamide acetyltransferase [Minwuia thermotolerans]